MQLIVLLNPDFNYWRKFTLSCFDKVTTGTWSFVSVIANVPLPVGLVITQIDDHVKMKLTLKLINGTLKVLQKLLKYINGAIISTSFALSSAGGFAVIFFRFKWVRIC